MNLIDRLKRKHAGDPAGLTAAVAQKLYAAHHRTAGRDLTSIPDDEKPKWERRAVKVIRA